MKLIDRRMFSGMAVVIFCAAVWVLTGGWFWNRTVKVQSTRMLMSTPINVQIFIRGREKGERLIEKAFEEAARIERIMEPLKGDGEVERLNKRTGGGWFRMSPELSCVLEASRKFWRLSDGAFDPTIAPVKWLWNFENGGRLPPEDILREKLRSVDFGRVDIRGDSIRFTDPGTRIDLGGVAKGYVVDRMIGILRDGGASAVLVNAGGDISFSGRKPGDISFLGRKSDGEDWVIGIRHPRMSRTFLIESNPYPSVATSGDYERFFTEDGIRYHHILDPSTGYPARGCISVTVWTPTAMQADILATTIFVLGPEKGLALAERRDDVESLIFFERDGKVEAVMSSGVKGHIRL